MDCTVNKWFLSPPNGVSGRLKKLSKNPVKFIANGSLKILANYPIIMNLDIQIERHFLNRLDKIIVSFFKQENCKQVW